MSDDADRITRLEFQITEMSAKALAMARGIADLSQKQSQIISDIGSGTSMSLAAILHELINRDVLDFQSAIAAIDATGAELASQDPARTAQIVPDQIILELRRLRAGSGL